jgi:hypothetical protein
MMAFVASIVGRVDIAVVLTPFLSSIIVVSPTRRLLPYYPILKGDMGITQWKVELSGTERHTKA